MAEGRLDAEAVSRVRAALSRWDVTEARCVRRFTLPGFDAVTAFVSQLFVLARSVDHHPDLQVGYDQVEVTLRTHSAGGVTERDVRMAGAIDRLYDAMAARTERAWPEALRKSREAALRAFVYGVVVVGSRAGDAWNGMTANWVTQISFEPCLYAVSVENDAHTRQLIEAGGVFSVNALPAEGGERLADIFVKPQRRVGNKLGEVAFHEGPVTGAPILDEAVAAVECELVTAYPAGDHTLFVGRVVGAETPNRGAPLTLHALGWHYAG